MDTKEEIKQLEDEMDALIELRSRYQCQDELYAFAQERLEEYRRRNRGKEVPPILRGVKDGVINEELYNTYMEKQYLGFSQYILECQHETGIDFEKIRHENEKRGRERQK